MTVTRDVNGLIIKYSMQPTRITVRMTSDSKGKSLSLADEKEKCNADDTIGVNSKGFKADFKVGGI